LGLNESKKYILFLAKGNVTNFRKGGDIFEQLLKKAPKNLNFICVTENGYENFLKSYKNVYVFNKINNLEKLKELYLVADLNITLSRKECIPFSIIESMSCGIPNISFNTGGISEAIKHKKNGWLCKNNSISSVLNGIDFILSSKKIQNKFSVNSRKMILEKFSSANHKKNFRNVLK
jgi:glycosyltransferase involved in cell wall biosynthesis